MIPKQPVAIVVGGGSGLGAATARILAVDYRVAVLDCNMSAASQVADDIQGVAREVDVTDADAVLHNISQLAEQLGELRVGVNCAGILTAGKLISANGLLSTHAFEQSWRVNALGTFNVMRALAAVMTNNTPIDAERGVVINTTSIAAYEGQRGQCAYSAAKGAVAAMTLPAARDLAPHGIRVVAIAPGLMQTPMLGALDKTRQQSLVDAVTFPSRLGDPVEFAKLVRHIIENQYINATEIRLDAGLRMTN